MNSVHLQYFSYSQVSLTAHMYVQKSAMLMYIDNVITLLALES